MSYIIKNTSGLVNTRVTDVGRRRISEGNFVISYFQIGDSEVNYKISPNYNQVNNMILMPAFNSQNDNGVPNSNKQYVKYPYYVDGTTGNTYGIPYEDSRVQEVYNSATMRGFFDTGTTTPWIVQTGTGYTKNSNYYFDLGPIAGQNTLTITPSPCQTTINVPEVNDFITIFFDGVGSCNEVQSSPILTYKIQEITPNGSDYDLTLDRNLPDYSDWGAYSYNARCQIYPSGMTVLYDTITPLPFWQIDTLNFESPCDVINRENTLVWNMNIPWSESPAGIFSTTDETYEKFGSIEYNGTKEYLGYQEPTGQTDTSEVYYYNSFDEKVVLSPSDQKAIAIIHYTNQDIDFVYGEKFATKPFDPDNPTDDTGLARHFKLSLPTLMWHKTTGTTIGVDFFISPVGYDDLCVPYYIKSNKNDDMNDPGIRYYHLWDNNPDENNHLNRIGKVFPDQQIVVIDDEEIVAALSYKANRNWTLPAPKLSLITPNTCFPNNQTLTGIMKTSTDRMWVTYIFENTGFTNSLHCNYYSSIYGPDTTCTTTEQNIAIRFGAEFPFLTQNKTYQGFSANKLKLLCQKVSGDVRPDPAQWVVIDVTDQISGSSINGYLTMSGITGTTFQIDETTYNNAPIYDLSDYMDVVPTGSPEILNFGDEYYFYGNIVTDITATIYEMRYLITLGKNQFKNTSNPTWTNGTTSYVTDIGLYNEQKELLVISKLQAPEKRQGIQQLVVKIDF